MPAERGPRGEPTVAEFAATDLLDIVQTFSALWDQLAMPYTGRHEDGDLYIHTGLVYAAVVRGQLSPVDGAIELIDINIDVHGPDLGDVDVDEDEDEQGD